MLRCWCLFVAGEPGLKTPPYRPLTENSDGLADPVLKVALAVSDLQKSVNYWSNLLGMKIYEKDEEKQRALLGYGDNQVSPFGRLTK